ncbi:hypothetical protein [Nonomuraea typhae]|uniref:MFS transporter n=1 Tax=Nonomuraea typhae TaxID=2603600 RepID=A0ABW7ZEZ6_9ACTN
MRRALVIATMLLGQLLLAGALAPAGAAAAPARVALIGVSGLHWTDITAQDTPHLFKLSQSSALGSMSVRTVGSVTCPYDGWLTVSAGIRSAAGYSCGAAPAPGQSGDGAVIPGYRYLIDVAGQKNAGALGETLKRAGTPTLAIGDGAALALADTTGAVPAYRATPQQASAADLERARLIVMDVDDLVRPYLADGKMAREPERLNPADRRAAARLADAEAGALLSALPAGTTVMVSGVSDHGNVPHLRVAMLNEPGAQGRMLGAASTRRADISILPDLTTTILAKLGLAVPSTIIGQVWETGAQGASAEKTAHADESAQTMRSVKGAYFTFLAVLQVLFYVLAFVLLRRRKGLSWVRLAAVALAALPVTSFLVNLVPWTSHVELFGAMLGFWAALTALALLGPWARHPLGPTAVVAGVTALTLAGDLLTGTTLQLNSFMGFSAEQGARYYGLGNIPFALLATGTLLATTVVAHRYPGKIGAAVVAVAGTFAMVLGGSGLGSDFGGVIAFVPGIAVTALLILGKRVSLLKLALFCVAGGLAVTAFAVANYLKPAGEQSHLGRFVGQVLNGEAVEVVWRKFEAMISTLVNPNLVPIVAAALGFLVYAILRPEKASAGVVPAAFAFSPALKAGLIGTLVSGVVGMLVNDSGAAILSMALAMAIPLLLSAGIAVLPGRGGDDHGPDGEPADMALSAPGSGRGTP